MRRCGVLGSPIAHSLSPVLHRAAYRELGLDWEYSAHEVTEAEFEPFVDGLDESWRGLSLTMPLKPAGFRVADQVPDSLAENMRAVNTLLIVDGKRTIEGYNTDVDGFVAALRENGVDFVGDVLIVGGGATAASAISAVRQMGGYRATVAARDPAKARPVADLGYRYGLETTVVDLAAAARIPSASVLISTIPADAQAAYADALVERAPVVFDVLYDPVRTPLLEAAERAGRTIIGGFDLLLHQAARQVELMTEVDRAPLQAMREDGLAALGNR
jgi:shikimate dehydrogenase